MQLDSQLLAGPLPRLTAERRVTHPFSLACPRLGTRKNIQQLLCWKLLGWGEVNEEKPTECGCQKPDQSDRGSQKDFFLKHWGARQSPPPPPPQHIARIAGHISAFGSYAFRDKLETDWCKSLATADRSLVFPDRSSARKQASS